jgi:hypothetical protein
VSQWYIFNDFTINPIPPEEAVWFNLKWKIPCIICFTAEKLPLNLEKLTLKVFYFDGNIKVDSSIDDFLLETSRNRFLAVPKRLSAMLHSAESRLRAMRQSAEFLQKVSTTTLRYATQREIQVEIFWPTLRYAA